MTQLAHRTTRWIRGYEKQGDTLVEEFPLQDVKLSELQSLFGTDEDDPMVDCYAVSPRQAAELVRYLPQPLRLHALDYFLECDAEPAGAPREQRATRSRSE